MNEIIYRSKDIAALARRVTGDLYLGQILSFALSSDPDEILCEVDTYGKISPTTGTTIFEIRVLPSVHAEELAERIWERLDWDEVATVDGSETSLEQLIRESGLTLEQAYSCLSVQEVAPPLGTSPGIRKVGWSVRRIAF